MSMLQCRGSIARAAVVLALISSRSADAQVVAAGPPTQPDDLYNNLITGVQYDILNQARAERRLQAVHARFRRDKERGDSAAANHDAHRIGELKFRIAVDEWLIRKNLLLDPGYYPFRADALSCAVIAAAARPPDAPVPPWPVQGPWPMTATSTTASPTTTRR